MGDGDRFGGSGRGVRGRAGGGAHQAPIAHRNRQRLPHEGGFDVGGHVVRALVRVAVVVALRSDAVEGVVQVQGNVGARVLVDREARRGVHDEKVGEPDLVLLELLLQLLHELPRDHVAPPRLRRQPHHFLRPQRDPAGPRAPRQRHHPPRQADRPQPTPPPPPPSPRHLLALQKLRG